MCLQFGFVIFWQKEFGAKAAHKMLVKLTLGWKDLSGRYVASYFAYLSVTKKKFDKIDICGQFHKTFFSVIYAAVIVLTLVLTKVTPLGA